MITLKMWIMPAPGDAGSAIGAVLAHKKKRLNSLHIWDIRFYIIIQIVVLLII